jgi:hypothetical protein
MMKLQSFFLLLAVLFSADAAKFRRLRGESSGINSNYLGLASDSRCGYGRGRSRCMTNDSMDKIEDAEIAIAAKAPEIAPDMSMSLSMSMSMSMSMSI